MDACRLIFSRFPFSTPKPDRPALAPLSFPADAVF